MKQLKEIKENLKLIQLEYETQGYINTNDADDLINYCKELIGMVESASPELKKPSYMDLDDE